MVEQIFLVLTLQTLFFIVHYKFGYKIVSIIGRRVCPACFAVSSTWLTLLMFKYFGLFPLHRFLIALLLAESVAGVASLVELSTPVLKFGIILYGTLAVSVFAFAQEFLGLVLFAPVIIFGFFALTPIQKTQKPKKDLDSSMLKARLKNCC